MFSRFFVGRCALVSLISPWFLRQAVIKTCFASKPEAHGTLFFGNWRQKQKEQKHISIFTKQFRVFLFLFTKFFKTNIPSFCMSLYTNGLRVTRKKNTMARNAAAFFSLGKNWLHGCREIWGANVEKGWVFGACFDLDYLRKLGQDEWVITLTLGFQPPLKQWVLI